MQKKQAAQRRVDREYRRLYDQLSDTEITAFERVKARKKRQRGIKRRARLAFALIILLFIAYLALPVSRVQTVNVYENKIIDSASILAESDIKEGSSFVLFLFDYFIEQNIRENPFINGAKVEKHLDGTVNIFVSERWVVYKTQKNEQWIAYFSDGTSAPIPAEYNLDATVLIPVADQANFPYAELAQSLGYVPRQIVDKISEIKHNPSNLEDARFMFYMNDRNRVSIFISNIKRRMKYYDKLVENSNGERFEYVMEHTEKGIIGRKIKD